MFLRTSAGEGMTDGVVGEADVQKNAYLKNSVDIRTDLLRFQHHVTVEIRPVGVQFLGIQEMCITIWYFDP